MSAADYFTKTALVGQTLARASAVNTNLTGIETGFGRLPDLAVLNTNRITFAVTAGAADVYTVALHKTAAAYYNGMCVDIEVHATNTGACTINVDSLGAKAIKIMNGTEPAAGDLTAGDYLTLRYDDTNGYFVITSTVRSIINGQASMSDAEIKTAYENNANTNAFTDAEKTKLGYLAVTGAVDLDNAGPQTYTASGAISLGEGMCLNSNGTVSAMAETNGTLTAGTAASFSHPTQTALKNGKNLVKISKGKFLMVTGDDDDAADRGEAFVITYDEDDVTATITNHTAVSYEAGYARVVATCLISENKVLAVYMDDDNSDYATAVVLRVDGTVVRPGTPVVFKSAAVNGNAIGQLSVCTIGENKAAIFCRSASANSEIFICTVSGMTPSFGSATTVDSNAATFANICTLDTDLFFLVYVDSGDSNYMNAVVGRADGTSAVLDTPARIAATAITGFLDCGLVKKEATGYRVACYGGQATSTGDLYLLTIDGDSFTVDDTLATIGGAKAFDVIGDTAAIWYGVGGTESVAIYDIDLPTDTLSVVDTWTPSGTIDNEASLTAVKDRMFMVAYEALSTGYINIIDVRNSNRDDFVGFAASTVADTETATSVPPGRVIAGQSGLTAGVKYYFDYDGSLTDEPNDHFAGTGYSATQIIAQV